MIRSAADLLMRVTNGEGRIVSSNELTTYQIAQAQAEARFYVEPEGCLGWAIMPWHLQCTRDSAREAQRAALAPQECAHV
jgi:hypothetical protein